MVFQIDDPDKSPRRLSQAVVQAGDMLGLVRAEVARILGFKCESITDLYNGRLLLETGSEAWQQGRLFVRFYRSLYQHTGGDEARMVHWLRREHRTLGTAPFYLIVDQGRLADVVAYLEGAASDDRAGQGRMG